MPPRSVWTGSISFGLVNIPVRAYTAVREHDVRFHQLAPDGSRIHYKRVSEKTGRDVDYDDIKRGYELSKGRFVVFEHDELDKIAPKATHTVDIEDFVALEDVDPIYFDRTYYLAPADDAAQKGYALLAGVMDDKQRVGIGKVVMREKQYLAAIRPFDKGLALTTMMFGDEVVDTSDIPEFRARRPSVSTREKQIAGQLLDSLEREWNPKRYHDDYEEQLRDIIKAKAKGKTIEAPEREERPEVIDLMEALQASLGKTGRRRGAAKKTARKATKKTAKKSTRTRSRSKARKAS